MQGIEYTLRLIALLKARKSDTQRIVSTFLGIMQVPLIQEERPVGERTPTLTSRLSLVLNLGSWDQEIR